MKVTDTGLTCKPIEMETFRISENWKFAKNEDWNIQGFLGFRFSGKGEGERGVNSRQFRKEKGTINSEPLD